MAIHQQYETIDAVIEELEQAHHRALLPAQKIELTSFAKWFVENQDYNLASGKKHHGRGPYFWLTTDATLLYMYIMGMREVKTERIGNATTIIDSIEKLPYLRSRGTMLEWWPDERLYSLFNRRYRAEDHGLPGYQQLIDIIGSYPAVQERFGRSISYANFRCKKTEYGRRVSR